MFETANRNFDHLNEIQRSAVFRTKGALLILAGAGSGKTTVLVNRVANIIQLGQARPWEILAITFTNKAAGELKERLAKMLGEQASGIWASTFHASCARILRRDAQRLGYTGHFTIYDTGDARRLIRECQKALNIEESKLACRFIMSEISKAKNAMIMPEEYAVTANADFRLKLISQVYTMYTKRLKECDAMDFDDLLIKTVELFENNRDVLENYQHRFKYIMIDEYQDTNRVQYLFAKLLAQKHGNICVVGDDDQSIYRFRGATIENILSFEKEYKDTVVIRLEQNYRSTENILNAANQVISNNLRRKGKNLWTQNGTGDKINLHCAYDEQQEARFIADKIVANVAKRGSYADHAVLYRMNAQANALENVFVRSGIPYRVIGGFRFYERKEIRDVIAYLSVINNPADNLRLSRVINEPKRGIGDTSIYRANEIGAALGLSLLEVLRRADEFETLRRSSARLCGAAAMFDDLIQKSAELSLHSLVEYLLDKTGYLAALKALGSAEEDRIDNINELSSSILNYERENEDATLSGFLEEVSLMTDIDNYDPEADAVILMTLHAAKGLEFPVVFIAGMEEGVFPGNMSIMGGPDEIEEERRLAYVGITRAKQRLFITRAQSRMLYGSTNRNPLSRFAREIPDELLEQTDDRPAQVQKPQPIIREKNQPNQKSYINTYNQSVNRESAAKESFSTGEQVGHPTFGQGTVKSTVPMGNDILLEIVFDKVGAKKLMANFAPLKKI